MMQRIVRPLDLFSSQTYCDVNWFSSRTPQPFVQFTYSALLFVPETFYCFVWCSDAHRDGTQFVVVVIPEARLKCALSAQLEEMQLNSSLDKCTMCVRAEFEEIPPSTKTLYGCVLIAYPSLEKNVRNSIITASIQIEVHRTKFFIIKIVISNFTVWTKLRDTIAAYARLHLHCTKREKRRQSPTRSFLLISHFD